MKTEKLYDGVNDSQFSRPYIDVDEWREAPVRHRYIHGGYEGTSSRFSFYFPPEEEFRGRFFQRLTPAQAPEDAAQFQEGIENYIAFAICHGAYFVETNMGGILNGGGDETLVYRCSAQAAQFSRKLALEIYGCGRPYGYLYGGSGGGFKTISCVENTIGIWDGAVPFVIGSPVVMPNVFTVRVHAMRILRNKMKQLVDAIEPGSMRDVYSLLNEEEAAALEEVTRMGFPMATWCEYDNIEDGALPVLYRHIPEFDPSYFTDFWTKPGYLGMDKEGSAVRDRIRFETVITGIHRKETEIRGLAESIDTQNAYGVDEAWKHLIGKGGMFPVLELDDFPQDDVYTNGLTMTFLDGELAGEQINLFWLGKKLVTGKPDTSGRNLKQIMEKIEEGVRVLIDNSDYLAVQTYHRHQVPELEFHAWDQFRDREGKPIYPQRPVLISPLIANLGAGSVQQGTPNVKIIVVDSLMDESAFPWNADWYRQKVIQNFGSSSENVMRLWYMDKCMHTESEDAKVVDRQRMVSFLGALYQALLDLSDWVERDIEPAATSGYAVEESVVSLPDTANERKGIQPIVVLTAEGCSEKRLEIKTGQEIDFTANIEMPAGSGEVEAVLWDFDAENDFRSIGTVSKTLLDKDGIGRAEAHVRHVYEKSGTYFPVVKTVTNRTPGDPFTRIYNLDRIRVVVTD